MLAQRLRRWANIGQTLAEGVGTLPAATVICSYLRHPNVKSGTILRQPSL